MRAFYNDHDDTKSSASNKSKASYKKLALDTSFSRHRAPPPQQVFPTAAESQNVPALSTTQSISTSSAIRRVLGRKPSRRVPSTRRTANRRRPSPLVLDQDSMRDGRLAVNGTAGLLGEPLKSAQVEVMRSATILAYKTYDTSISRTPIYELGVPTPRIIITPARESFTASPDPSTASTACRPASSVYSKFTHYLPDLLHHDQAPPVPNVPPFQRVATGKGHLVTLHHHSTATNFEEDHASIYTKSDKSPSSSQALEELDQLTPLPSDIRGMTPGLPTPQRSEGWWNFLTSPFSARSGSFFSRSPSINEHDDVDELRPDSRQDDRSMRADSGRFLKPFRPLKRSSTAPGALDPHAKEEFSIYYIAHNGEAEAYFDASRNFPSVCGISDASNFRELEDRPNGWSPSQSVHRHSRTANGIVGMRGEFVQSPEQITPKAMFQAIPSEAIAQATDASPAGASQKSVIRPSVFTSPSEDEMKTTKLPIVSPPSRSYTQVTGADSLMSPLSATPVVQHAHMATLFGPDTSHGELREVDVSSRRSSPSNQISSRNMESDVGEIKPANLGHQRQESYGLGITSEKVSRPLSLPPPPRENTGSSSSSSALSEKEHAISVRSLEEGDRVQKTPWYRRFFWYIAAVAAALLTLIIVLLVLFVPPRQQTSSSSSNLSIQASWLNTTGFPAMPIGASTVVQPQLAQVDGSCMPSSSLWSCNAGSEQGLDNGVDGAIPNFRLQISFLNGTLPVNQTGLLSRHLNSRIESHQDRVHLSARNAATDVLFTPVPSPPSIDDQRFIGQTVDGITSAPYEGEETPFFLSLLSPKVLTKRADFSDAASSSMSKRTPGTSAFPYPTDNSSTSSPSTNITNTTTSPSSAPPPLSIPTQQNGQIASPILYPLAAAQPLRLFNRGLPTEHYSVYTYYTRSLITTNPNATALLATLSNNTNTTITTSSPSSTTPAAATQYALLYTHSRFHIQIWTRRGNLHSLPPTASSSSAGSPPVDAKVSSANVFTGTGSFPYPVTMTLDRPAAGKDADASGGREVYAVRLDPGTGKVGGPGFWVPENRGKIGGRDGARGGVNGGSGGGCVCQWTTTTTTTTA